MYKMPRIDELVKLHFRKGFSNTEFLSSPLPHKHSGFISIRTSKTS